MRAGLASAGDVRAPEREEGVELMRSLRPERPVEDPDRLGDLPAVAQGHTEVIEGRSVVRTELEHLPVHPNRLVELSVLPQRVRQTDARVLPLDLLRQEMIPSTTGAVSSPSPLLTRAATASLSAPGWLPGGIRR